MSAKAEQEGKFAQIVTERTFFYNADKQPIFCLPKTFYCKLLKNVDAEGFYYCKYINIYGYVKKSDVQCVSSVPQKPYLDYVNFRILASQSAELRSEPTKQNGISGLICSLDLYETNFILYGEMQGEELVSRRGDVWFYCEYKKDNTSYFGYVYSGLCDQVKDFEPLPLDENIVDEHIWTAENEETMQSENHSESLTFVMPNKNQMIIITCISVPILLLILFLFMPYKVSGKIIKPKPIKNGDSKEAGAKIVSMPTKSSRKIRKAEKGKDFYELN